MLCKITKLYTIICYL